MFSKITQSPGHYPVSELARDALKNGREVYGWGAAAILAAIDEGLAGIEDLGVCYEQIDLPPRDQPPDLLAGGTGREVRCYILLPDDQPDCTSVFLNGAAVDVLISQIRTSHYVGFTYTRETTPGPHREWPVHDFDCLEVKLQ